MNNTLKIVILLSFLSIAVLNAKDNDTESKFAKLSGRVINQNNGEPLIGARVFLKGTKKGAISKKDGSFEIKNVVPSTYEVLFSYIGFSKKVLNIELNYGENKELKVELESKDLKLSDVVVTAKAINESKSALLNKRKKEVAFSNSIGAEDIKKTGSSSAADAMKKITGATITGGKYVQIRGLGERYASTSLNGTSLPSSDPDKKSVNLDLFSSNMIENITTIKTATPDQPGNFTGGVVNIKTKSFPDKFLANVSYSTEYNTNVKGGEILSISGVNDKFFGSSDKPKEPSLLNNQLLPSKTDAFMDINSANTLDEFTKSFNNNMLPTFIPTTMNKKINFTIGDNYSIDESPIGFTLNINYNNKSTSFDDGIIARYNLTGNIETSEKLDTMKNLSEIRGKTSINYGVMGNLSFIPTANHEISFNYINSVSQEAIASEQSGFSDAISEESIFQRKTMEFSDRNINTYQLNGKHTFNKLYKSELDWNLSMNNSIQDNPDIREFNSHYSLNSDENPVYRFSSNYTRPSRYFRKMNEDLNIATLNFTFPLKELLSINSNIKTGLFLSDRDREFSQRIYRYDMVQSYFQGDARDLFSEENLGINEEKSNEYFNAFNNIIEEDDVSTDANGNKINKNDYYGSEGIYAFYGMVDWSINKDLRIITGARLEYTDMRAITLDTTKADGSINKKDFLPSLNVIYMLNKDMKIKAAFSRTLARPLLREFAGFSSYNFKTHRIEIGNPELKRTLVSNYDLRWEWFTNPGEIISISSFYKDFINPINSVIIDPNGQVQFNNVDSGILFGVEFEYVVNLENLLSYLENFSLSTNLTWIYSEATIAEEEFNRIKALNIDASDKRNMMGQAPYIINFDISYFNNETNTSLNTNFNVSGKRLSVVGFNGTPDIYQSPKPELNFIASQLLFDKIKLSLSVKNILNSKFTETINFKNTDYIYSQYSEGSSISLGISYNFN